MENLINEIIDAPKMVSDKIPGNITSMVQGSDGNISKWVGMFYRVVTTLPILGALYNLASPCGRRSAFLQEWILYLCLLYLSRMYAVSMSDVIGYG